MGNVQIGTSGWHYSSWRNKFFHAGLRLSDQLEYYATQFSTVELNGVFYRTPTKGAVEDWYRRTGDDFVFCWKASKCITHWKRLSDRCESSLELLYDRAAHLRDRLGPLLFQLPPNFKADEARLGKFLKLHSRHYQYAFSGFRLHSRPWSGRSL